MAFPGGYQQTTMLLLFVVPLLLVSTLQDKAVEVLTKHGSGPDEKWVSRVIDGLQTLKLRRTKAGRQGTGKTDKEMKEHMEKFREVVGPKSNVTSSSEFEAHPDVANVTLEGDMIPNPDQIDNLLGMSSQEQPSRARREAITDPKFLWSVNTPIPYVIDSSLNDIRSDILKGIQFWNDNTCLTFQENPSAVGRLRIYRGSGCWSYIGKQPNWTSQDVSIGNGCNVFGTICHELAHALGFYHTQSRYDRDSFIYVNYANIQPSLQYNFVKQTPKTETHFGLSYDYGSVMQYNPYAFAINYDNPTSMASDPVNQNMMGQRDNVAFSDVKQMNALYKCDTKCKSSMNCQRNGIVNSKTCNSCLCPNYFTGNQCEKLKTGTATVCNGQTLQASSTQASFNATVGYGMTYVYYTNPVDCYWSVKAPAGKKVQFWITSLNTNCMEGCNWAGFEINTGNLDMSGFLTCCSSISSQTFVSSSNEIAIRGYSRYNNGNLVLSYVAV